MLQPKYPQKELLIEIKNDLIYPSNWVELSRIVDSLNYQNTLFFHKCDEFVIITSIRSEIMAGDRSFKRIGQFEAPLEFLRWFSKALEDYITTSSQGGLHPGAMTSQDQDVGGEMMCIQRAMDAGNNQQGYTVVNRSREDRFTKSLNAYAPQKIIFAENFLYEGGLLNLIKDLGEKFERGKL